MAGRPATDTEIAESLIDKLREFAAALEPAERQLLAALLAPGVRAAWEDGPEGGSEGEPDVQGYGVTWTPGRLPDHLAATIRGRQLRVEGW